MAESEYESKAQREAEALRKANEAEAHEGLRDDITKLEGEVKLYQGALLILAQEAQMWLGCSRCPTGLAKRCEPAKGCATNITEWAIARAREQW